MRQIHPQQQAGAFTVRFGDAGIQRLLRKAGIDLTGRGFHGGALRPEQQQAVVLHHRQRHTLPVQEFVESFALLFGDQNRGMLPSGRRHDVDLVAQIIAGGTQHFDGPGYPRSSRVQLRFAGSPPSSAPTPFRRPQDTAPGWECSRRTLCRRANGPAVCSNNAVPAQQAGAQLLQQIFAVAAPGDFIAHRFRLHVGAGYGLIAGAKNFLLVVLGNMHFALHHGNARAFYASGDAEERAGDGDAAIAGIHIQMARACGGRPDDHAAAAQMDGQIEHVCARWKGSERSRISTSEPSPVAGWRRNPWRCAIPHRPAAPAPSVDG